MSTQEEQMGVMRNALIQALFTEYNKMAVLIKNLPLDKATPVFQKALLDIDTGVLWIRETILTAPLIVQSAPQSEPPKDDNHPIQETPSIEG
jgi:hypothetical protein